MAEEEMRLGAGLVADVVLDLEERRLAGGVGGCRLSEGVLSIPPRPSFLPCVQVNIKRRSEASSTMTDPGLLITVYRVICNRMTQIL